MKINATVNDLRYRVKTLLKEISLGQEVIIISRGKSIAKLIAIEDENCLDHEDELFGIWADHKPSEDVDAYIRAIR